MENETIQTPPPDPVAEALEHRGVLRRIRRTAFGAWLVFAVILLVFRGFYAVLGLTCSAAVAMINFFWLEDILVKVLQPTPDAKAWRVGVRTVVRFLLFGAALSVSIFVVQFDTLGVLLGFSIIVVGIMGEAVYLTWKSYRK